MEQTDTTQVFMIPAEAAMFLVFQEHYEAISILLNADVFSQRNGSVTLHFDSNGTLQSIQRADYLYSRKHT